MSVIKHKSQRVGVFIDAQNLYHSAKNLYHSRVNFGQILKDALGDRTLVRAIAYVISTENGDEKAFFDALSKMGIEKRVKDLQIFSSGAKKADWDVGMAIDAVKLAPKLDAVVLVTGDGDFVPLVEYLKISGCQVEAVTFGRSASQKLVEAVDDFIDLDKDSRKYLTGNTSSYSGLQGTQKNQKNVRAGENRDNRIKRDPRRRNIGTQNQNTSNNKPLKDEKDTVERSSQV